MKSAKELFEELGYEQKINDKNVLMYVRDLPEDYLISVIFWLGWERINIRNNYDEELSMKLLKAINKQVEELGWNDEKK